MYVYVSGVKNVSFSENFGCVLNKGLHPNVTSYSFHTSPLSWSLKNWSINLGVFSGEKY